MASKFNTKFVVMLVGVIILVFVGAAGTFLWVKNRSGDENEHRGDQYMAAADYVNAEKAFAKAVNKQQSNDRRLAKWIEAMSHLTPPGQTEYELKFLNDYRKALRNLAILRKDVPSHRAWLELTNDLISTQRFETQPNLDLITEVDTALKDFPEGDGPHQVLRRYSGQAMLRIVSNAPKVTEDQIKRAGDDLAAALAADPTDVDSALARVNLLGARVAIARRDRQAEAEQALRQELDAAVADVMTRFPDHPRVLTLNIRGKAEKILQEAGLLTELTPEERRERSIAVQDKITALTADLDAAVAKIEQSKDVEAGVISELTALEESIDAKSRLARTQRVILAQLAARPGEAMLHSALAAVLTQQGKIDEAIAEYQKLVDLPQPPLSIDGLRLYNLKAGSVVAQAELSLQQWFNTDDPAVRTAAMANLKKFRAAMTERGIRDEMAAVRLVDAKTKVAEQDWLAANKLLGQFFDAVGNDRQPDALLIHAQVLMQLNQPGAAREKAERLLTLQPGNGTAAKIYARALYMLEAKEQAIEQIRTIVQSFPDDIEAKQMLSMWEQELDPEKITDPVLRDLAQMDPAAATADQAEQLRALAVKHNQDPRIVAQLAQTLVEMQDKDGAVAAIKKGLAAHPDSADLKRLDDALAEPDTVAAMLKLVNESNLTDDDKMMRTYAILRGSRRNDDAAQLLKSALAKYPTDARFIELSFLEAIDRGDVDGANALADTAAKLDVDASEGLTYRARVYIMQRRMADAAATLRQAVSRKSASPEAWRLLARVQTSLGRSLDAIQAYEESLRLRPTDRETLREYIAYLSDQDATRALQVARDNARFAETDSAFKELLLRLEGRVGDKNAAVAERVKIAEKDPDNVNNLGALATLYLDLKDYPAARTRIDELKKLQDSLPVLMLDIRWNFEQKFADQGRKAMEDYIARQDQSKLTYEPFLAFGQYMVQRGLADEGLAMMMRGQPLQDPKKAEVDRTIGDTLSMLGRDQAAAEAYERVLATGGPDEGDLVRLRMAEIYLRLRECKKADDLLTQIKAGSQKENATAMLLAADSAECVGDTRRARELMDRAVTNFPDDPLVFVKRAEYLAREGTNDRDAMSDLEAALRLRPGFARALQVRSALYLRRNDQERALADLKTLVRANPQLAEVRDSLITDLLRRGKGDEAVEIANECVASRPGDLQLLLRMSDLFRSAEVWSEGARFALAAWDMSKEYDVGIRCLDALLNDPDGNLTRATEVLTTFQGEILQRPALLLCRAKLQSRRSPNNFARVQRQVNDDLTAALDLVPADRTDQLVAWRRDMRRWMLYPKPADAAAYLQEAASRSVHRDWALYFRAELLAQDETTFSVGVQEAQDLATRASNDTVKVLAYRLVGTAQLTRGDHERAVAAWSEGLKQFPEDWEMNNNAAFVLAKHLNKPQDGLPYAEQAVKSNPASSDAWDTLGWVQLKLGKLEEARQSLEKSMQIAGATYGRVPAMIHMGFYYAAKQDWEGARTILKDVKSLMAAMQSAPAEHKAELEELEKAIEGK
ncbi:MAG: Beta-barrel assembly-enhancing protease [Phycisphaerales bacterium]|nr:Beta-barrel assembly-enhancing protease [Phycisphaerales bacterium]